MSKGRAWAERQDSDQKEDQSDLLCELRSSQRLAWTMTRS